MKRYFAEIRNGVVTRIIVSKEAVTGDDWVETWRDAQERKNYAGVGYTYDANRDAFIPPKPFNSWVLDEGTCRWKAPSDYPADGSIYFWDEQTTSWVEVPGEAV